MMHEIIVSLDSPHRLLAIEFGTDEILGYTEQLLRGRTLQVFHGPTTDSVSITSAVKASFFFTTTKLQLNLYELSGLCRTVSAIFEPFSDAGGVPVGCKFSFEVSQAITMDQAVEDPSGASLLISANQSQRIDFTGHRIPLLFGFTSSQLMGNTIAELAAVPTHLSTIIQSAESGRVQRDIVRIRTASFEDIACNVTCIPVVPRQGAQISHVLLVLAPASTSSPSPNCATLEDQAASPQSCPNNAGMHASAHRAPATGCAVRAAAAAPVTLELLRSLGDVPLYRAAERLGMSPSSLKTACRRLGLARWPRAADAAAAAAGCGGQVSVAYARRLYRKYAAAAARAARRTAGGGGCADGTAPAGGIRTADAWAAEDSERPEFGWDRHGPSASPSESSLFSESDMSEEPAGLLPGLPGPADAGAWGGGDFVGWEGRHLTTNHHLTTGQMGDSVGWEGPEGAWWGRRGEEAAAAALAAAAWGECGCGPI